MALRIPGTPSETQRKRSLHQRMFLVHGFIFIALLIIVARLIELQVIRGTEYHELAQAQHYGGVVLPAKRGEILSYNSKTGETSILATNTTLDMVYVDPVITDDPAKIADLLSTALVTEQFHALCSKGDPACPRELVPYYAAAFDPLARVAKAFTGVLLEPERLKVMQTPLDPAQIPDLGEVRRLFARAIESRIGEKRVTFVPLVYSATKAQIQAVRDLAVPGVDVSVGSRLISADPEVVNQMQLGSIARQLSDIVGMDQTALKNLLRSRPLRYVPIMRALPPKLSSVIRELKLQSLKDTRERKQNAPTREAADRIADPLRSIALLAEHWRYYPDGTVGSHVVGFLNALQEAQYGVERTFNPQLRGQEGLISTVSDPQGGQILTSEQTIVDPKDGDTVILTIDRFIQQEVERALSEWVEKVDAESAQAIVMDPFTGRILAMANAPLFNANDYGMVYEKEPIYLDDGKRKEIVVDIIHPQTNAFVLRGYIGDIFTSEGRANLSTEKSKQLTEIEQLYDLKDVVRYYIYLGENNRMEIFPTDSPDVWLKYKNSIGVGAYLNRVVQSIYEPGSVFKPITMAIALDQGEVTPTDTYEDLAPVKVDEYTIKNALNTYFGHVTMTNCLEFSINTCMTTVSAKLGRKLFYTMIERFGFGRVTGIELEDEQPGEVLPWRNWSNALLATSAYGQGLSSTPLQVITGWCALANGGKLMRPTIIDSIVHNDGTAEKTQPKVIDQVITSDASATITAMLVSSGRNGYAKAGKVPGYRIAGKTGTSQIAGPGGKYETGTGSTFATYAGYAPPDHPKFVLLVKLDRPKAKGIIHGAQAAAPVFKEIAAFLFKYYGIPPDDL
ncbi:MAG: penicillin-binding protein 2 [Candidatus Peribacteraceae bacterium]|nr:penicillin-binding protein 2 [Candidatus Peribacteraceae bacterium]